MRKSVQILFIFALLQNTAAIAGESYNWKSFRESEWEFSAKGDYDQVTANYSRAGNQFERLPSGYSYSLITADFGIRHVLTPNWAFSSKLEIGAASSENPVSNRTNTGISDVWLGAEYNFFSSSSFDLIPEFLFAFPVQQVDPAQDKVLIGEGAMQFHGILNAQMKWGLIQPFLALGFNYRSEGRSALLTFRGGAEMDLNGFFIGGEALGYQSVLDDTYLNNPSRRERLAIYNGNALKFYTVNPSILESQFWARWDRNTAWAFKAGGGLTLAGSATAAGWNAFGQIIYRFQPESNFVAPSPLNSQPLRDVEKFKEEVNDGVDQNLFKPPPETPAPPARKKKKSSQPSEEELLQQKLKNTEMTIELKRKKKKQKSN